MDLLSFLKALWLVNVLLSALCLYRSHRNLVKTEALTSEVENMLAYLRAIKNKEGNNNG